MPVTFLLLWLLSFSIFWGNTVNFVHLMTDEGRQTILDACHFFTSKPFVIHILLSAQIFM